MREKDNDNISFEERELKILRESIDALENKNKKIIAQSPIILNIIKILETFLSKKKLICYGGTALNNILPEGIYYHSFC